jgi:N-carbamoylputrescine amidase
MSTIRAAMVQSEWTGDKQSMVDKNVEYARSAASQGAQVLCSQEIFSSSYFCNVQDPKYYDEAEEIPSGPTVQRMMAVAKETEMVLVVPIYERVDEGTFYNTAAVIDADGSFLGIYRKTHIPQVEGFWEKFYFRPGNLGYPVFDTAVGRIGVYICYDRHFPEGWRVLGLKGAKIVFNPSATTRGHSRYLWELEQSAAAVANEYFVGAINRVGDEGLVDTDYYGSSYFASPRGQLIGGAASDTEDEVLVRDLDMSLIEEVRRQWAFHRDRRPDAYSAISET